MPMNGSSVARRRAVKIGLIVAAILFVASLVMRVDRYLSNAPVDIAGGHRLLGSWRAWRRHGRWSLLLCGAEEEVTASGHDVPEAIACNMS